MDCMLVFVPIKIPTVENAARVILLTKELETYTETVLENKKVHGKQVSHQVLDLYINNTRKISIWL